MLTNIIDDDSLSQIKSFIQTAQHTVIVTHVNPDGDAIGSSLGLLHFLKAMGKQVSIVVPNDFPSFYYWMPGAKDIINFEKRPEMSQRLLDEADLIFCLDFNELKRIDRLAPLVGAAHARKVLIDHHLFPSDFCDVTVSHAVVCSTSELIYRLCYRLGNTDLISFACAECIYAGMMTDTGSFTYNSNRKDIYLIISDLIGKGIDKDLIYRRVNQVSTEARMRMEGFVLYEKMKIYKDKHTALITLTDEELKRFHYHTGDTEGFVNLPLCIDDIVFSVFLREGKDCVRVSLRSVGDFPSNRFAQIYFNGGGHKNASGGEFYGTMEEAVKIFEKGLSEFDPCGA